MKGFKKRPKNFPRRLRRQGFCGPPLTYPRGVGKQWYDLDVNDQGSVPDPFLPTVLSTAGTAAAAGSGGRKESGTDPNLVQRPSPIGQQKKKFKPVRTAHFFVEWRSQIVRPHLFEGVRGDRAAFFSLGPWSDHNSCGCYTEDF